MISYKDQIYALISYYLHLCCYLTTIYTGITIIRLPDSSILYPIILLTLQLFESCNINLLTRFPVAYPIDNYYIIRYSTHLLYVILNIFISITSIYGLIVFDEGDVILYYLSMIVLSRILITITLWTIISIIVIYECDFIKIRKSNAKILIQFLEGLNPDNNHSL
jgi:hypothetical protein